MALIDFYTTMRLGNAIGTLMYCMPTLESGRADLVLPINERYHQGLRLSADTTVSGFVVTREDENFFRCIYLLPIFIWFACLYVKQLGK